ncbi:MAG: class I SAM-dependent rRNA methyltransferase [Rhodospirillales bacterium]
MTTSAPRVFLDKSRDRRVAEGHPWAYSNEVRMDAETRALPAGTIATLHRVDGKPLGVGAFNPHALVAFRLFDRDPRTVIDEGFLSRRLQRALALRERLFDGPFYRLAHAEADGLPGLIVDRFADVVVLQVNIAGMEALTPAVLAAVGEVLAPRAVVLRNDSRMRALEGLGNEVRIAAGALEGAIEVREGGLVFAVDPLTGQKTGWYYDQRENRAFCASLGAGGRTLDVYCHSGGFAVAAARHGATEVVGVDSSQVALDLAHRAAQANGVEPICRFTRADVFETLERLGGAGERFRLVVADPPPFVKSRKELGSGLRGYRKLARLAAAVVEPGGFLFIASCSHTVEAAAFDAEVVRGLTAAGRGGRIIRIAGAGPDHPIHPHLPETAYLKALVLQLD